MPLYREDGSPNDTMIAAYSAISGETVNIADAYVAKGFDFSGTRKFDERTGYRVRNPSSPYRCATTRAKLSVCCN